MAISANASTTLRYSHGDKSIAFHTCKTCGWTPHWENLMAEGTRMAVNLRLSDLTSIADIPIWHFNGAITGKYLD